MELLKKVQVSSIIVFFICSLLGSCANRAQESKNENVEKSAVEDSVDIHTNEKEVSIVFSTEGLDTASWISPEEYPLKTVGHDGNIYDNIDDIVLLHDHRDYNIVVWSTVGGDNNPYHLRIVKSGVIQRNGLNIAPIWSAPGDEDSQYRKIHFEIYSDYTIRLDKEERDYDDLTPIHTTKYYRISDDGEFYEVSESNL